MLVIKFVVLILMYKVLAERVRYFKEIEEGVAATCKNVEDMRNEELIDDRKDTACRLYRYILQKAVWSR